MGKIGLGLSLLLVCVGCNRVGESSQEQVLAVAKPDLSDRQDSVKRVINTGFDALKVAADSADSKNLAEAYGQTGMLLQANAFPLAAEASYREAMGLDPKDYQWPYLMGYMASQNEDWETAVTWFQRCLQLEPRYSGAHMRLGRIFLQLGKLDEAETEFRWILEVNEQSAAANFGLGKIAVERKDFPTAIRLFETVLTRMPKATAVHYPLAMAYRQMGEREKARAMLAKRGKEDTSFFDPIIAALEGLDASPEEAMRRGLAALDANQFDRAQAQLARAVSLAPNNASAHLNYGFLWLKKQDWSLAKIHFEKALGLKPDMVEAQTNLGVSFAMQGDDTAAIQAFVRALQINPTFAGARVLLGNALMRLDRFEEALVIHKMIMEQKPQNSRAFFYYGLTLVKLHREVEALHHFETSVILFPNQAELVEARARLLACATVAEVRDEIRALKLAEGLFQARQNLAHAQTLAMALAANGKFAEAIDLQGQVLAKVDGQSHPRLAEELAFRLETYRAGKPCRQPWSGGDALLRPGPP